MLADLDVNYGQGYALARPGPAWPQADEAMLEVLRRRSARSDLDPMDDIGSTPRPATGAWSTSARASRRAPPSTSWRPCLGSSRWSSTRTTSACRAGIVPAAR